MLITVEGIDGSGKSATCTALSRAIPGAVMTAEPTTSWYGDAVRRSIEDSDADPLAELFLYTADHADHLSRLVRPALARGEIVISDRYSDSRYAYQGASLDGVVSEPIQYVQGLHTPWTRPPDLTIYLDVPPSVGAERSAKANKFEREAFLETVARNYERLIDAEPDRFVRVDATQPQDSVVTEVESVLRAAMQAEENGNR